MILIFFLEQNNPTGKLCLIDKSLSSCKIELDGDSFDSKTKETFDKIFSVTLIFVQTWWHTHCITYHYSCNTDTLSIPSNSELQNS